MKERQKEAMPLIQKLNVHCSHVDAFFSHHGHIYIQPAKKLANNNETRRASAKSKHVLVWPCPALTPKLSVLWKMSFFSLSLIPPQPLCLLAKVEFAVVTCLACQHLAGDLLFRTFSCECEVVQSDSKNNLSRACFPEGLCALSDSCDDISWL